MNAVDPRLRFPVLPMTEEEAQTIMRVETENGFMLDTARGCALALRILRSNDEELEEIISYLESIGVPCRLSPST